MKIADIDIKELSEGSGENPQGTSPLTHFRALPEPVLAGRQEKGAVAPFLLDRMIRELYVNRLSRHILTVGSAAFASERRRTVFIEQKIRRREPILPSFSRMQADISACPISLH